MWLPIQMVNFFLWCSWFHIMQKKSSFLFLEWEISSRQMESIKNQEFCSSYQCYWNAFYHRPFFNEYFYHPFAVCIEIEFCCFVILLNLFLYLNFLVSSNWRFKSNALWFTWTLRGVLMADLLNQFWVTLSL